MWRRQTPTIEGACILVLAIVRVIAPHLSRTIGGDHQQTSERAAPPVSVEEKGKTTEDKKENCYYFCLFSRAVTRPDADRRCQAPGNAPLETTPKRRLLEWHPVSYMELG
jgi:hypothetical protein